MKRLILISIVLLSTIMPTMADGNDVDIQLRKETEEEQPKTRSLFRFSVEASISSATQLITVECSMPPSNGTVYIVDEAGSTVASHTLHTQMQVSLPMPQHQCYYTIVIDCDQGVYTGEFEIMIND